MKISEVCTHLIRTFPEYYADMSRVDGNYTIKNRSSFHAIDALGYGLMAVPQNMNAMLETVSDIPDYLRPENIGKMDPTELRHHRNEYRRMKSARDASSSARDVYTGEMIPAGEFWGTPDLDDDLSIAPYNPFGGVL
jgi:hypothetical protein